MIKDDAMTTLRRIYPRGSTVYTIVRSASRTNMSRVLGFVAIHARPGDPLNFETWAPNYAVSALLGLHLNKDQDGVRIGGAGMDMGLHLASNLARHLYGDESALKHRWL